MNWIFADPSKEAEVNTEVRRTVQAALKTTIHEASSTETRTRFNPNLATMTVGYTSDRREQVIDRSDERKEELWAVAKMIKLNLKRNLVEYINKHRVLRLDMIAAGCSEIGTNNETSTIRHITSGVDRNEAWHNFRTLWKIINAAVWPKNIVELERLMSEDARDSNGTNEWQPDNKLMWQFPNEQASGGRGIGTCERWKERVEGTGRGQRKTNRQKMETTRKQPKVVQTQQ